MDKKKILFVDDDEFIAKIFQDRLLAAGFEVDLASSVRAGQDKIELNKNYDLICLDYVLPDKSGMEALKWIRQEKHLTMPVIIFSASGNEVKAEEFIKAGANAYLQKDHVSPGEFVGKINSLLKQHV